MQELLFASDSRHQSCEADVHQKYKMDYIFSKCIVISAYRSSTIWEIDIIRFGFSSKNIFVETICIISMLGTISWTLPKTEIAIGLFVKWKVFTRYPICSADMTQNFHFALGCLLIQSLACCIIPLCSGLIKSKQSVASWGESVICEAVNWLCLYTINELFSS